MVEAGGFLSVESVFLVTLGAALIGIFGLWAYGQIQHFSKVFFLIRYQLYIYIYLCVNIAGEAKFQGIISTTIDSYYIFSSDLSFKL